jgi:hypothetical protein
MLIFLLPAESTDAIHLVYLPIELVSQVAAAAATAAAAGEGAAAGQRWCV